ncbi:MAG: DNA-deoxyinosine glycosylase [Ruminiclostridium sp.]|nr:DNA-deoxyinosine glycosylase [Ruminiclostridium sp.]
MRHTFEPVFDDNSRILILGTMPSVKSRAGNFYYMHPQNLFWRVMSNILETQFPETINEKKKILLDNHIALWDILKSCEIEGSSDSTIRKPIPNDFSEILCKTRIKAIFTNGIKATQLYKRYCRRSTGIDSIYLPSTSPANRKNYDFCKVCAAWREMLIYIK